MSDYVIECLTFLLRWLHVVAAIAWIGESFYFVALDRGLKPPKEAEGNLYGESWSVHGGGFYRKQKYLPAPLQLPAEVHWSKWKSYTTWMSGFALFTAIYLLSPQIYLIDPAVAAWTPTQAVATAVAFPLIGWLLYDGLCRLLEDRDDMLGVAVAGLVLLLCYAATHLFAGRAAFLLAGAVLGSIMSANVFFVIIPGQKKIIAALEKGEAPDPLPGRRGKQRSVHNTYFTLPVVFAMLSTHYATAYAHADGWLVLAAFMAAGALLRQFFVVWHSGERAWSLLAVGAAMLFGVFAWIRPLPRTTVAAPSSVAASSAPIAAVVAGPLPETAAVMPVVAKHCAICHSAHPQLMGAAPKGIVFDTAFELESHRAIVGRQVGVLRVMPPGNLTGMSEEERAVLARWAGE
ncbi:putative membrane protein [Tahibacter aquaticus]|uniref:Putative membrane protein n=1 Tax=Tahibacter aquaticus TaxID=520092 RepID=A0A4R6YMP8_9GAMM|nr:urate hydroxylase PuuD [Tahibacter aquaticus]TDR38720.1 putative membrane protein [Tahibacter aquaticus]